MTAKPRNYYLWIGGIALRAALSLLVVAVCVFWLWRVLFSAAIPSDFKHIQPNAALKAAFDANGGELTAFTQEQASVTRGDENYGYFGVPRFLFFREADQVQVVFRYNNSTLEAVQADLGLAETPARGERIFDITLLLLNDTTPEDLSDNTDGSDTVSKTRIHATAEPRVETTLLYTYFYYIFDGVELTDSTLVVYLDVYADTPLGTAPDYTKDAMGTLRLYHAQAECREETLSARERRALSEFVG